MMNEQSFGAKLEEIKPEIKNSLELFEFFLTERSLKKPIDDLAQIVRDMRIVMQRLLNFFLMLSPEHEVELTTLLANQLVDVCDRVPRDGKQDEEYQRYCIEQILVPFEWATEIKLAYADSPEMQRMLAADIPILRPFDYGLQGKMAILQPKAKQR